MPLHTGMALAYLSSDHSMKAIAEVFGVHYSTFSQAVKAYNGITVNDWLADILSHELQSYDQIWCIENQAAACC